ncbi:MAG: wcaG [Candidatus Paceibacter sp.]|jgi:GDP-L-fucose synthase|nr:wcaG [Candidatus Paceibacter sp.]
MPNKNQKNVLVIGASGFVGQALLKKLVTTKSDLFLVSRNKKFKYPDATIFYGDIENKKFSEKILKNIDTVFYLAAYKKNIAVHTNTPFEVLLHNVRPLLNFLEAAKNSQVKNIVYISSTNAAYALDADEMIDGYVYGKFITEMIAKAFSQETGISVKIVRSSAVYGPGDNLDPKTANFIPAMIRRVDEANDELVVWGKGKRKLQFMYIDDLVANILAAEKSHKDFLIFGNPEVVSVNDVVTKITTIIGKKLKISHDIAKPDKPTKLSTFQNIITPKINLDSGLQKTLDYYRKHHA